MLCYVEFFFGGVIVLFFFFKQKTAYEMRISDWSSDVCSSDLMVVDLDAAPHREARVASELGRGADADRHDDEAGGDQCAVLELHPFDLAGADDLGGVGPGQDRLAARFERI